MSDKSIIFFLMCMVLLLLVVVCYQQFVFGRGIQDKLKKISEKLSEILEKDSDEKVMVFTDNKVLISLSGQINRMLLDRQKVKADYRKQELSTKKMLANISHDIKTPLTVILGYLEITRMENKEDEMLQKVETKARQVMELINQFFTLAKLEAGDLNVEIMKIDIGELCRENVLDFYELLISKEFTVELSIPEQNYFVQGDKESINRILNNLLSNAIRYGSDGKYIGLFLREDGNEIYIDIVDKGKGIEKQFAKSVFERLYTMEDSRNREIQGNGLGLTIAKNLARQMGGDIVLESEPGVKTVFTLILKKILY
ncbi:sensor histidine kinase [Parablautia intestinalis]|uniref:histidine kinase n=1 Tax=Parablautia intestinalis TaxID=2320100 RepID=A0A3A9AEU8_9FIRM|nr:sensor histidine kinase [Parablautia intestinalis]RKI90122.1 sensor histidine kinase [Parablautia intestinalis]